MQLALRHAAGLPVNVCATIGLGISLYHFIFTPSRLPLGMALFQAGGPMFVGAIASMILILPNVAAAALANRLAASAPWPVYGLCFAVAFFVAFVVQARILDKWLRGDIDFGDSKLLAFLAANIAVCLAFAAYMSMRGAR